MSDQDPKKADELRKLLERVPASGSFESANITERIATLAKELFSPNSAPRRATADQRVA